MFSRNSSFDYSMETSDSEDAESAFGGYASNILSNLDESIGKIDTYLAIERGFVPGDIVRSIENTSGQMGRIVNLDMFVDLEDNYGDIVKDVNSTWLQKVHPIAEGDYVVCGSWLGKVDTVYKGITVLLDDGSKYELASRDLEGVTPISTDFSEDGQFVYYPGQRVKIDILACNKFSRWFCSSSDGGSGEGTISAVCINSVLVNWIASVMAGSDVHVPIPSRFQNVQSLTLLSCFSHANWQLGDCCKLHPDYPWNSQSILNGQDLLNTKSQDRARMSRQTKQSTSQPLYTISKTRTKVGVSWQDGSYSVGLDVQNLVPVGTVGDHDFWRGQIVLDRNTFENPNISSVRQLGMVKAVDSGECVLAVKWVDQIGQFGNFMGGLVEESVSAYDLIEHPDYSFCLGDIVFRLLPYVDKSKENFRSYVDNKIKSCGLSNSDIHLHHLTEQNKVSGILGEDHCNDAVIYLSCIGNVVGIVEESVEVKWANGITSKVGLGEVVGLGKIDAYNSTHMPTQEGFNPKGFTELDVQNLSNIMEESENIQYKGRKEESLWMSGAAVLTRPIIGFFSKFASYVSGLAGPYFVSLETRSDHCDDNKAFHQNLGSLNIDKVKTFDHQLEISEEPNFQKDVMGSILDQFQASKMIDLEINVGIDETGKKFKQFNIVKDCLDHHFANDICQARAEPQARRCWLKKIQQEWNMLEGGLPDNIYVRAYEERMDLLRACIVGSDLTPYQDALFFFDICFPPEYPHKPPMVHYISGGLRLNPNLYESGKVCLSLLNTWMGTGSEVWNSKSSSILQVLLSIQALVLNAKPYFNEAGFDKEIGRAEAERNSEFYNENAFLLSRKSMLYHIVRPPKHFEAVVEDHFTGRAVHILSTCKAYLDGLKTEYDIKSGEIDSENPCNASGGFKMILKKLLPKLVLAFAERGIECSEFLDEATSLPEVGKESS